MGKIVCGTCIASLGGFLILFVLAFASMIDPALSGRQWWSEFVVHISSGNGWPPIFLGAILLVSGIVLVASGARGLRRGG
ncbi:hypothetical protein [Tautonia marina]|uniref:hypothetical protein n=1 Tax=Tautonia marina TaxID=2653855 RepID=UPI001260440B|nr:hypothetical protein [Tautonia marina]